MTFQSTSTSPPNPPAAPQPQASVSSLTTSNTQDQSSLDDSDDSQGLLQNIKKLLDFTANAGPQKLENMWTQYVNRNNRISAVDEQFCEFKQLLDTVVKPTSLQQSKKQTQPTRSIDTILALPSFPKNKTDFKNN